MKLIGAGFGRTGTLSTKGALERLGLGPCYHMMEVIGHPDKADMWYAATRGEAVDWDLLLDGYQSSVDWPACHFWRPLSEHYPDAKVLLTVRDEDAWWNSIRQTIFRNFLTDDVVTDPDRIRQRRMARTLIVDHVFGGILEDRDHEVAIYRRNIEEVTATIPADRLLVFDVAQGWAPLCEFLGVPVPDEPFPRTNDTKEFQKRAAERRAAAEAKADG